MNLEPHITEQLNKIEILLNGTQWVRKDEFFWEFNIDGDKSYFSIYPVLLTYYEDMKYVTKIWFKINERAFTDNSKEVLFNCLAPFKDEDYRGSYYWISPEYPKGYWYNHTL